MATKKIKLMGEEIEVQFNLAVQIAYEDITGKAFDLTTIKTRKDEAALYMASIIANNPDTGIDMDKLMRNATKDEILTLDTALSEKIAEWYKITELMKGEAEPQKKGKNPRK